MWRVRPRVENIHSGCFIQWLFLSYWKEYFMYSSVSQERPHTSVRIRNVRILHSELNKRFPPGLRGKWKYRSGTPFFFQLNNERAVQLKTCSAWLHSHKASVHAGTNANTLQLTQELLLAIFPLWCWRRPQILQCDSSSSLPASSSASPYMISTSQKDLQQANKSQIRLPFPALPFYSLGKGEWWHNFWRVFGVLALPELMSERSTRQRLLHHLFELLLPDEFV